VGSAEAADPVVMVLESKAALELGDKELATQMDKGGGAGLLLEGPWSGGGAGSGGHRVKHALALG
jgi:hypothetical protein